MLQKEFYAKTISWLMAMSCRRQEDYSPVTALFLRAMCENLNFQSLLEYSRMIKKERKADWRARLRDDLDLAETIQHAREEYKSY